jgi:hypothetical protein
MSKIYLLFRAVTCLIVAVCVMEICARLDDTLTDRAPLIGPYGYSAMLTYDEFGVVGKPHAHYRKWKLNGQGYRGPEIRWDRERIICIGASETFGFAESEGMEYPRQLERELNKRTGSERYQVVNVGYAGQSLRSYSRRAGKVDAITQPHLALIYPSLAYYFDDSSAGADPVDWVKDQPGFESHLRTKVFDLLATLPEWVETLRFEFHIWKATRHTKTIQRVPELNVVRFHQDLNKVLDQLQRDHVQPVLITHATRFGQRVLPEERPTLIAWRRFLPTLEEPAFLDIENRLNNVIRSEAASRNILLIDASDRLYGRANFVDFGHFTNRGATAMSNIIANRLLTTNNLNVSSGASDNVAALGHSKNGVLR